ncbi:MAG TPA: 50S ribosomal protein L3 [Myxococcota bacterium]|nr:50S ribosomal protein L3 [Myxococcota bacterium]
MAIELLCRKIGMTRLYDESGGSVAVTVLEAGPNPVVQKKTPEKDGYSALQLGFLSRSPKNLTKAMKGHFEKSKVAPLRHLKESRVAAEDATKYEVGQDVRCDLFEAGQIVDVIGTTKGRGTSGVVKRHNFSVHTEGHGTHEFFRHGGSIGSNSDPGKVIKGLRMSGRYGNERVTTRNVRVMKVDAGRNLLFLRGSVPGHANAVVRVRVAPSAG